MKTGILSKSIVSVMFTALAMFGQEAMAATQPGIDHARAATYYRQAAATYTQKQVGAEQTAARWQKQFADWTKSPNPYRSATNLAAYYKQAAADAIAHAAERETAATN
jgi:hypothetical protein